MVSRLAWFKITRGDLYEEQVLKGRKENKKVLWSSRKPILFQVELDTAHFGGSIHSFG